MIESLSYVQLNVMSLPLQVPNIDSGNITEISKAVLVYSSLRFFQRAGERNDI